MSEQAAPDQLTQGERSAMLSLAIIQGDPARFDGAMSLVWSRWFAIRAELESEPCAV